MSAVKKSNFWRALLEPINPHLCVLAGVLNLIYGIWSGVPGKGDLDERYRFIEYLVPNEAWGIALAVFGLAMILVHRFFYNTTILCYAMAANGVVWAIMSGLIVFSDWRANSWILMAIICIYSMFVSANLKINYVKAKRKPIKI